MKKLDLTGKRFGIMTAMESMKVPGKRNTHWVCWCDCGNECVVQISNLRYGNQQSCGCLIPEKAREDNTTHGQARSAEYRNWAGMKNRCTNPKATDYKYWGGKGIKVCDRWMNSFENFLADMGPRPSPKHSLDRFPNNCGHYEPGNVRWATHYEQMRNQTSNHWIVWNGDKMILQDLSTLVGIDSRRLSIGLKRGHDIKSIVTFYQKKMKGENPKRINVCAE